MPQDVLVKVQSTQLALALQNGNSAQTAFQLMQPQQNPPVYYPSTQAQISGQSDGVFTAGGGGEISPNRLKLVPYCQGAPGSQFSFRVYAWTEINNTLNSINGVAWMPLFLAEFLCTAASLPGFPGALIGAEMNFCDTVALTQGSVGPTGGLYSTGPGSGLLAFATLELTGPRKFSFDFQMADPSNPITMNCLWAAE